MNLFSTGAMGYVGGPVAHGLVKAGHRTSTILSPSICSSQKPGRERSMRAGPDGRPRDRRLPM
jgi:nucleoside-diphosphate-sugar epimerase